MVGTNDSWQYQGRQEHGWFGHGTGPGHAPSDADELLFGPGGLAERAEAVANGAFAALPRHLQGLGGTVHASGAARRLPDLLVRWSGAAGLDAQGFGAHFFGRRGDDGAVQGLRIAALGIATARDHQDLRRASEGVAAAMQSVGLGNWNRFLADAQDRADDPATLAAVAASRARPAARAPLVLAADAEPYSAPAAATEPAHGAIWWWLHGLGLTETWHEQATGLRRVMGSGGGLVYLRDGVPLDVDRMSDDEVLALDRETRGQGHGPPLIGAAAPIMTSWGWDSTPSYNKAIAELSQPGTHETLNGRIPTREEAVRMIEEIGGTVVRIEEGHPPGRSTHNDPHINYYLPRGKGDRLIRATVVVKPWK